MASPFAVSVVLSTYNRCDLLGSALEARLAQRNDSPPFEVVVVDNNSNDQTRAVIECFTRRSTRFRYVFEPRQGLSYGLNTGIAHSSAPLIAFTDDDVIAAPDWVANVKRTFDEHPEVDFLGGRVLPLWTQTPPAWLTRRHWTPLALQDDERPFYSNAATRRGILGKCFRRAVFDQIGLFSPALGRTPGDIGSIEDRDLITRLWKAGRQGLHAPDVVVYANVQPVRLTKSYHRRWHTGHGQFLAIMRDEHFELSSRRCLGVPAHVLRQTAAHLAGWTYDIVRGDAAGAFARETQILFLAGFTWQRLRDFVGSDRPRPGRAAAPGQPVTKRFWPDRGLRALFAPGATYR
jgi:glycosyltransferase involved in cell wall biosynthesis